MNAKKHELSRGVMTALSAPLSALADAIADKAKASKATGETAKTAWGTFWVAFVGFTDGVTYSDEKKAQKIAFRFIRDTLEDAGMKDASAKSYASTLSHSAIRIMSGEDAPTNSKGGTPAYADVRKWLQADDVKARNKLLADIAAGLKGWNTPSIEWLAKHFSEELGYGRGMEKGATCNPFRLVAERKEREKAKQGETGEAPAATAEPTDTATVPTAIAA